jgi:hypothetical protein
VRSTLDVVSVAGDTAALKMRAESNALSTIESFVFQAAVTKVTL